MEKAQNESCGEEVPPDVIAGYLQVYDSRVGTEPQGNSVGSPEENPTKERLGTIPIWGQQFLKIGRDAKSNTFSIDSDSEFNVSRNHCEVYVVVYEESINHVFVRDRKSINGTYVNGTLIGVGPNVTPGHLLDNGDEIELRPYWRFKLSQTASPKRHALTRIQVEECKLFADRYLVTNRCLGEGAEACVHLATDTKTKKQLVCKLVNFRKIRSRHSINQVQRSFQEADILRQLHHPNILSYVDSISSPHTLYTFTELASGGDLMSFIYRHSFIDEFDVRVIIRQVVSGLQFLHSQGVVHRDLKPENILLAFSPKLLNYRVMLSDFGTSSVPRSNRMTSNVGTATYQAPELALGSMQTPAVDIWSMGIITLILLVPLADDQLSELGRLDQEHLDQHIGELNAKARSRRSSKGLNFVQRCLRIRPEERLTATRANAHSWLSTPGRHLEFFQQLDDKMLVEWRHQQQFRPMPLSLESPTHVGECNHDSFLEHGSKMVLPMHNDSSIENSGSIDAHRDEHQCHELKYPFAGNKTDPVDNGQNPKSLGHKVRETRTAGFVQPMLGKVGLEPQLKTKGTRTVVAKHGDSIFLPLAGLQKHLQPPQCRSQREQVLEALRKTNSKFLNNRDQSIGDPYALP